MAPSWWRHKCSKHPSIWSNCCGSIKAAARSENLCRSLSNGGLGCHEALIWIHTLENVNVRWVNRMMPAWVAPWAWVTSAPVPTGTHISLFLSLTWLIHVYLQACGREGGQEKKYSRWWPWLGYETRSKRWTMGKKVRTRDFRERRK